MEHLSPYDALMTPEAFKEITDAMSVFQLRVVTVLIEHEDDLPLEVRQVFRAALSDFVFVAGEHMDIAGALDDMEAEAERLGLTTDEAA